MKKLFLSIFLLLIVSFVGLIFYLSFYGYETDKFNNIIKSEIKKSEKNIDLNFEKVSILLDVKKLTLFIKFIDPKVEYQSATIPLDMLRANIDLVSTLKKEIGIKKIIVETKYLDFKSIKPAISQLKVDQFDKSSFEKIKKSKIKINSEFSFDQNYELGDNFVLTGIVKDTEFIHDKNHKISELNFYFSYKNKQLKIRNLSSKYNEIDISNGKIEFYKTKGAISFKVDTKISLQNNKIRLPIINKSTKVDESFSLKADLSLKKNKSILIKNLTLKNEDNLFKIDHLVLNKNYNLSDFKNIEVRTKENKKINNDFSIKNSKESIIVDGEIFDATILLKELDEPGKKNNFLKKISKNIEADFTKVLTDTEFPFNKFRMVGSLKKGKLEKISAKSEFEEDKFLDISIKKEKKTNMSIVEIYSDIARPLVNSYEFFEGLEGGNLTYTSKSNDKNSSGVLEIKKFKLNKAPGLAKLLSLADLKGLTDALRGEGISFDSLIIKYESSSTWMDIKEIFLIGPSISVLVEGYFDKKKDILSLRGTLVPAKTLNSIVSKIPVVGDILIGKKVGEGVFGLSFKIKGPTDNLKTTVNPVKTLTPRFITRALEEMKKKQSK
tara:strand:+ start:3468 stop:5294 length:1827 start_codon:yes stop_codon:yes gene_type:complete